MSRETVVDDSALNRSVISLRSKQQDAPKVLVLGDSHAGHLRFGLMHHLAPQGIDDISSVTGCPPLFGMTKQATSDPEPSQLCVDYDTSRKNLAVNKDYDTVVLAARWNALVGDQDIGTFSLSQNYLLPIHSMDADLDIETSRMLFETSLTNTVENILEARKTVILFGQIPTTGRDMSQCNSLFQHVSGMPLSAGGVPK